MYFTFEIVRDGEIKYTPNIVSCMHHYYSWDILYSIGILTKCDFFSENHNGR